MGLDYFGDLAYIYMIWSYKIVVYTLDKYTYIGYYPQTQLISCIVS